MSCISVHFTFGVALANQKVQVRNKNGVTEAMIPAFFIFYRVRGGQRTSQLDHLVTSSISDPNCPNQRELKRLGGIWLDTFK